MRFFMLAIIALSQFAFGRAEVAEFSIPLEDSSFSYAKFPERDGTCQIHDGIPDPNDNSNGLYRRYVPKGPLNPAPICGEPKYDVLRACARKYFYEEVGKPKSLYSDAVLYLINGCLRCPSGEAVATVRLVNKLPSGALFSSCKAEDRIISEVTVKLKPAGRDSHAYGIFALGGILNGRNCGVFGHDKELEFLEVVLEFRHNCGRKKEMLLQVMMPPVKVDKIRDRGNFREWDGISLNLAIHGAGWDSRWVDFGRVRRQNEVRPELQLVEKSQNAPVPHSASKGKSPSVGAKTAHESIVRIVADQKNNDNQQQQASSADEGTNEATADESAQAEASQWQWPDWMSLARSPSAIIGAVVVIALIGFICYKLLSCICSNCRGNRVGAGHDDDNSDKGNMIC